MPRRRSVGSVYRRRRTGKGADGKPRTGYYPGWYMRLRKDGREISRYAGTDRQTALDLLERVRREQDRLELLDEEPQSDIRFEDFAEQYLTWAKRAFTTASYVSRRSVVRSQLVPAFKGLALHSIKPPRIERFIAKRRAEVSGATCNRNLGALSSMFQRAVKLGYVSENPAERIDRDRERATALPLLSDGEQETLITEIPKDFQPLFLTALDTGMRLSEMLRLEWGDIDLTTGRIRIRLSKNKRTRFVHATGRVLARLLELHAARVLAIRGPDLVFRGADSSGALRSTWRKAFKKAAATIGRPELRVHDLRHLCAINLVRRGMDLPSVQAVLGHTSLISTLRYAAFQDDTAASRAAALLDGLQRR